MTQIASGIDALYHDLGYLPQSDFVIGQVLTKVAELLGQAAADQPDAVRTALANFAWDLRQQVRHPRPSR